jgi:hypothetical protein
MFSAAAKDDDLVAPRSRNPERFSLEISLKLKSPQQAEQLFWLSGWHMIIVS